MGRRPESSGPPNADSIGKRADTIPQGASPAEAYGFVGFVLTGFLFAAYVCWAFVPDETLSDLGIRHYPDKYWALAVPVWIFALGLYVAWAYEGINLISVKPEDHEDFIAERDGSIPTSGGFGRGNADVDPVADPPGSVPSIRDVPIEEVNRVLYRTRGGDSRTRKRRVT